MTSNKSILAAVLLLSLSFHPLRGEDTLLKINLRFFEAAKTGEAAVPQVVTSSYLHPTVQASLESNFELEEVRNQIKRVFNLGNLRILTEAGLIWNSKNGDKISHTLRLDGKEYLVWITPSKGDNFRLEVFEKSGIQKTSLLDTKMILPYKNIAVFGFEDKQGRPYFLSFHVADRLVTDALTPKIEEVFSQGPVRAKGDIKPPKLIKMVQPVYPERARKAGIEGAVVIEARADEAGRVADARILKSIPELDQAAVDAVRQWTYEPLVVENKLRSVIFTVTVAFRLDKGKKKSVEVGVEGDVKGGVQGGVEGGVQGGILSEKEQEEFAKGAVRAVGDITPPKLIKEVAPVYPEEARKNGIEGIVILEVKTDLKGNVVDAKILRSIPELNAAAIDAVRQWKYEPMVVQGKPTGIVFTVTARFSLNGDKKKGEENIRAATGEINLKDLEEFAKGAVIVGGDVKPPNLIKQIAPVYPDEARKNNVEGVVILAAKTNEKGEVTAVKVLSSVPALDKEAADAVRQWRYEPMLINGKPTPVVFTVTVRFQLK